MDGLFYRPARRIADWQKGFPANISALANRSLATNSYFCLMQLSTEHQELVNFFANRPLPSGPQHVNSYSVFLNLPGAVEVQLNQLRSEVEASRKSAAAILREVQNWVMAGQPQLFDTTQLISE